MNKKKILIAGITALTVLLASGVMAFAAADTKTTQTQTGKGPSAMASLSDTQRDSVFQARADSMKEAVASLLEKGTITQTEADAILAGMPTQEKGNGPCGNLTSDQRNALQTETKSVMDAAIAKLVSEGTITQEQADQMTPGKGMMRSQNLTDDQRAAIMNAHLDSMKTAIANLVEKGTLTQDEADSITPDPSKANTQKGNSMMQSLTQDQMTALHNATQANLKTKIEGLVDEETLTQDQADQLLSDQGLAGMGHRMGPGNGGPGCPGGNGGQGRHGGLMNQNSSGVEESDL